ncbi:hypothetical protein V5O48_014183 [Marasmius crinis-equi]|uniref:Peptidase C14 caspase domain-containing protein n=1 Tax=Marasmius crinis-equi TaxID=585013 RepID=A0ABR3EY17_9AGAR
MRFTGIKGEPRNVPELHWHLYTQHNDGTPIQNSESGGGDSAQAPPPITVVERPSSSSLFALIIGIHIYKDDEIRNLNGAVAEADAFSNLLEDVYRVPVERIVNIRDQEATREKILSAIQNLAGNPVIGVSDPMVIYYAGHGAEVDSPLGTARKIQMLIPHDFVANGSAVTQGQGIFDHTLSRLLSEIAKNKSDDITVIFDSCSSGLGIRKDEHDETLSVCGLELSADYTIPPSMFEPELASLERSSGSEMGGLWSPVLLAACKPSQTAKERRGSGAFTSQLIPLLRQEGSDRLTYEDVIQRTPDLPDQNPQCTDRTRIVFDGKVTDPRCTLYNLRPTVKASQSHNDADEFTLRAREAHGVTIEAEFAVYSDREMSHCLGSVKANQITPFDTRCSLLGDSLSKVPQPVYAHLTRIGQQQDLRLFIEPRGGLLNIVRQLDEMRQSNINDHKRSFLLLDNIDEGCDLALTLRDDRFIRFHIMDPVCQSYGVKTMPFEDISTDNSTLISIMRGAADFYWNLRNSSNSKIMDYIDVECLKLVDTGQVRADLYDVFEPEDGRNLNVGGTIIINVDEGAKYGYRIHNRSPVGLFVSLFYFDPNDLSVESKDPYYLPSIAANGETEFSIPPKGSLTIGFGNNDSGTFAYEYVLRDDQVADVGFLKLYVSTDGSIDHSYISQRSPFGEECQRLPSGRKKRYLLDSKVFPIIQQRGSDLTSRQFEAGGLRTG